MPDPHAEVYAALARGLRTHPLLDCVKVWRGPEGCPADGLPRSTGQLPSLRLVPAGLPAEPDSYASHSRPLRVQVEISVPGKGTPAAYAALADLAGRVESALFRRRAGTPEGQATRRLWDAVRAAGASDLVPEQPCLPAAADDYGDAITIGRGSFRVNIFVETR